MLEVGLANALVVAALVPIAALATRIAKRPAWAHTLWVIVLLKLVTPPIAGIPIGTTWTRTEPAGEIKIEKPVVAAEPLLVEPVASFADVKTVDLPTDRPIEAPAPTRTWYRPDVTWPRVLGTVWLAGSVAWLILAVWRIGRFSRVMRRADEAPEALTAWVEELASRLGLARTPIVILSPGRLAPMVWAIGGRARLVVPESLWKRLDPPQRAALLVHELAHLKRRDHWVRLLELIATGLYWWHPALWWARKGLHRAEEECCDLWVVWALPDAKRTYATALVEAVEFLSETRPHRLPIGASGMGQVEDLTRRIGMIMRGDTPRGLSRTGFLTAIGLALFLLPWRPTLAQQEPPKPDESKPAAADVRDDLNTLILKNRLERARLHLEWAKEMLKRGYIQKSQVLLAEEALLDAQKLLKSSEPLKGDDIKPEAPKDVQENLDDYTKKTTDAYRTLRERLRLAQAQEARSKVLEKQHAISAQEMELARAQVLELQAKIAALEGRDRAEAEEQEQAAVRARDEVEILKSNLQASKAAIDRATAMRRLPLAIYKRLEGMAKRGKSFVSPDEQEKANAELAIAEALVAQAQAASNEIEVKLNQAARRAKLLSERAQVLSKTPVMPKPTNRNADKRLDELESKLDRVLKELESLRKEKADLPGGTQNLQPNSKVEIDALMKDINALLKDTKLSNEDVARKLFLIFYNREANAPEMRYAMWLLGAYTQRQTAVYEIVLRIAPNWFLAAHSPFVDQLAEDEKVLLRLKARSIYRSLRYEATGQELQDFTSQIKVSGMTERDAINALVQKLLKLRGEPRPIVESTQ